MLTNIIDDIRTKRANFARDVEYVKESVIEDTIDERIEVAESMYVKESVEELEEAVKLVNSISTEADTMQENAEIERILTANENLSFDEMIGIDA